MALGWLRKWWGELREARHVELMPEQRVVVTADAEGIRAAYPDGSLQQILWREVTRVLIETNDSGPWGADFWWIIEGASARCAYPQGATGESEAMKTLGDALPGFDWKAVVEANTSTSNARFVCWDAQTQSSGAQ
jgi:hypothetical protein